jgi:hypothetical protein
MCLCLVIRSRCQLGYTLDNDITAAVSQTFQGNKPEGTCRPATYSNTSRFQDLLQHFKSPLGQPDDQPPDDHDDHPHGELPHEGLPHEEPLHEELPHEELPQFVLPCAP